MACRLAGRERSAGRVGVSGGKPVLFVLSRIMCYAMPCPAMPCGARVREQVVEHAGQE